MEGASCFLLIGGTCDAPTEVFSTCAPHLSNLLISESISCICVSKSALSVWKEVKLELEINNSEIGLQYSQPFSVICSPGSLDSMFFPFLKSASSFSPESNRAKLSSVDLTVVSEDFALFER
nr:hypothetical protein CFP56_02132 [Quercus suber]